MKKEQPENRKRNHWLKFRKGATCYVKLYKPDIIYLFGDERVKENVKGKKLYTFCLREKKRRKKIEKNPDNKLRNIHVSEISTCHFYKISIPEIKN